ncbi:hypothetical protein BV20DRAFT_1050747 [Pilatotrama ljubarskyi]|nr:hypothetical protein BV20DRAFT_1050747 [Pilatotrama ljubarskyi]
MVNMRTLLAVPFAALASQVAIAAPARRQLGDLQCNIDRGEIIFNVGQLASTVASISNATGFASANNTADADLKTLQTGVQGVAGAVKGIILTLANGENAPPDLRTQVAHNLTDIRLALGNLSSSDNTTSALLNMANTQLINADLAATGVFTNCK